MKVKFLIIFFILLYIYQLFYARCDFICAEQIQNKDEDSTVIKNKIETNLKKINSFIADMEIRENKTERITGKFFYKSSPCPKTKEIWEFPGGQKTIKYTSKDYEIIYMPNANMAIKKLEKDKSLSDETILLLGINLKKGDAYEDKDYYYYEIDLPVPDNSSMTDEIPVKMKTLFNKKYGYVNESIFINRKGEELEIQEFKNYQLNIPIEDKEFEFVPPEGCQVVFREEAKTRN